MPSVFSGLRVLDLSWGVAGPMAAMVLADEGAQVTKIEPPGGDPFRELGRSRLGYRTWQRGKRSAILDLKDPDDLEAFRRLAAQADVLIESFSEGVTARLGVDFETLAALNPRLVYVTIDPYRDSRHAGRRGYDLLVAARMGLHWEHRGWPEGMVHHAAGRPDPCPEIDSPLEWRQGPPREGPIVTGVPWVSLGAFYSALIGVSAALYARETTGRGQHVATSLMHGAAVSAHVAWQRAEEPDAPSFASAVMNCKAPKGHYECADGRWIHNWGANPRFVLGAAAGDTINLTPDMTNPEHPTGFGAPLQGMAANIRYTPILAKAVKKFTCDEWLAAAAASDVALQEARSVETALADPLLLADGCVREVQDPELGTIRQLGTLVSFDRTPSAPGGPAPAAGEHTAQVKAEAAALAPSSPAVRAASPPTPGGPLAGVRVLDLGLLLAGPFAGQVLGDLGADVIKVNAFYEAGWLRSHFAFVCNRSKRGVCLDLKQPEGRQILYDLVKTCDVVLTNMRMDAARRLGLDYESLRKIQPDLIYCHGRGHERGPRESLPGNEQTAACIAGIQHEDGGMADGGKPLWCITSIGDTAAAFLMANGVIEALYHRKRTGEGQFLSTAIVNAHMLNGSFVVAGPNGETFERPRLDRMQYGLSALYGLYETKDRWLALAALTEGEWQALRAALPKAGLDDDAFATAELRRANDKRLRELLAGVFLGDTAEAWRARLDAAGAPCEISDEVISQTVHDDPDFERLGLTVHFDNPLVGRLDQVGLYAALSDTPGAITRGPLVLGESTEEVLLELGYSPERIAELVAGRTVGVWRPGEPLIEGAAPARATRSNPPPTWAAPAPERV